jgi:acetyl-CoA C-acetyltransferase
MARNVAVVGIGQTSFTRACGVSIRELAFDAFKEALDDARNLGTKEIDASIIASAPEYDKQRSPAGLIAEYLGLNPQPTFCIEAICASSTVGIRNAWALISSGLHDVVAVIGFQKMSELTSAESQERMLRGGDIVWESPFGPTMPSYYAMLAQAHINKFGTTEEQLALVRKKSSRYGATNHKAMFQKEVTVEQVLTSKVISSPLKLFDCCSNADGASCTILASDKVARKINDTPIWITGLGLASASMSLAGRDTYTSLTCARNAAQQAYKMAKIKPKEVDVAQVHDCFTIAEILAYEDLDFCPRGEGGKLIQNGETYVGGKIPVNTDGGLLSKGHPIGATGGSHVRTIVRQLRGEAGSTQVNNAEIGLVHNVGGAGIYGSVLILRR